MDLPKMRTYRLFKSVPGIEPYLYITNRNHRQALTRFRLSAHHLHIETGRWSKTPVENRICKMCDNQDIEDEQHFLLSCPSFSELRTDLLTTANQEIGDFTNMDNTRKFTQILTTNNSRLLHELAKFIHLSFMKRTEIMMDQQPEETLN